MLSTSTALTLVLTDSALVFLQGGARALDLPLGDVSQVTRNKNDITVEFHQDDTLSFHEVA